MQSISLGDWQQAVYYRIRFQRQSPHIAIFAAILLRGSRLSEAELRSATHATFVGRRYSSWVALGGVAIYTVLVGAEASVVRAAIMAAMFIFATPLLRGIHWAGLLSPRPAYSLRPFL